MNKILVLGDICVDVNYYGDVYKISPEAPIPIFTVKSKEEIPGMSGNIEKNLLNAGNEVMLFTKDNFDYSMTIKSRYFAGKHYLYRIDEDNTEVLKENEQSIVLGLISKIKDLKAVVLQDYNKGFFTHEFIDDIIKTIKKMNEKIIIVADGHKSREGSFYSGVDYLKVNEDEYKRLFPIIGTRKGVIETLGENGATLLTKDKDFHVDSKVDNVIDVTGAGDTFVSWFTSEMAKGRSEEEAMSIACKAASISVQHLGCYAPTIEDLND